MERYGRILMKQQEELEMFREKEEKEKEEGEKGEGQENGMVHFCSTHLLLHSNKQEIANNQKIVFAKILHFTLIP